MIKLIIYTENYFAGGLERFIFDLILSDIFDIHIMVNSDNKRVINFAKQYNISYTAIPLINFKILKYKDNKIIKLFNFIAYYISMIPNYFLLKRKLQDILIDNLLIVNGGYPAALSSFSMAIAGKRLGVKRVGLSILSTPSPYYNNKFFSFFHSKLDSFTDKYIDFYIPNSNKIKSELIKIGFKSDKIKTIYTGVNIPSNLRKYPTLNYKNLQLTKNNSEVWIAMIALLGSTKRQDLLIDAMSKIEDKNIKLLLIGDGPKKEMLIEKVKKLNLNNNIFFLGWIENPKFIYQFIDMIVYLSDHEGLPYAISEAMSYKIPIIASNVGGIPEQIDNKKGGLLIENSDIDSLVDKIQLLARDKELQQKYANYSFNKLKITFSVNRMKKEIFDLYTKN